MVVKKHSRNLQSELSVFDHFKEGGWKKKKKKKKKKGKIL